MRLTEAGYLALQTMYDLDPVPHYRQSHIRDRGHNRVEVGRDGFENHEYGPRYRPDDSLDGHLTFALKHEGLHLPTLAGVFDRCDPEALLRFIQDTPTGQVTRRVWFLYEWLTGKVLDLPDAPRQLSYVNVQGDDYLCAEPLLSPRHRVRDNLLGGPRFCPVVRRQALPKGWSHTALRDRALDIVATTPAALLQRATQFLYLKETRSSFAIEGEQPSPTRTERFVNLLRQRPRTEALDEGGFSRLQHAIVDPRYAEHGYREIQNYIGQSGPGFEMKVHYVCPKADDVPSLMDGLQGCYDRVSNLDPVVAAAIWSFGFVFVHPFEDGNGRLSRYLVHRCLKQAEFTPSGIVLPVSATMLAEQHKYDEVLERFSRPVMSRVKYNLDRGGVLEVTGSSLQHYRFIDMTPMVAYLAGVVTKTIESSLVDELRFLQVYDGARRAVREIVDMPDKKLDLFLRLTIGNQGHLSKVKRRRHYSELTDDEVKEMEAAVAEVMAGFA